MKVIIVGVDYYQKNQFKYYFEELSNLCSACGMEVIGTLSQKLPKIDNRTYIGSGKVAELEQMVEFEEPDLIVVNDELSGAQNKNIEKIINCKVMDRTQLILEIFAIRAKTKEAKLQVSIAQLKYQKPRMLGSYENLSRQGGGKAGTIARGSGETKLETDRRKIDHQIKLFETELKKFVNSRQLQRTKRRKNKIPVVSLVGYTNAGKSTLMNALIASDNQVFEKDMLFATLDTSVRKVILPNNQTFLLVDTVGFVSNLPHDLVKAFRSTLEEIVESDLIIHLNDLSNEYQQVHQQVVTQTLETLKVDHIPTITVNNKVDLVKDQSIIDENQINISARQRLNIDKLLATISNQIYQKHKLVTLKLPYDKIKLISKFQQYTAVDNIVYEQDFILLDVILSEIELEMYKDYIIKEIISQIVVEIN